MSVYENDRITALAPEPPHETRFLPRCVNFARDVQRTERCTRPALHSGPHVNDRIWLTPDGIAGAGAYTEWRREERRRLGL